MHQLLLLPVLLFFTGHELEPQWIWGTSEPAAGERCWFQRSFDVPAGLEAAELWTSCDNRLELWVNGERCAQNEEWSLAVRRDVAAFLRPGETNRVVALGTNDGGPAGFWFELELAFEGGGEQRLVSDDSWRVTTAEPEGWRAAEFEPEDGPGAWSVPVSFGELGVEPWGAPAGTVDGLPPRALAAQELELAPGFEAELVYTVPRSAQGSWVTLAPGPDGLLFASDQYGGIYAVHPSASGEGEHGTRVEELPLEVGQAQGLLWAFDALYFVGGTGGAGSGLYRATDTDGDGVLDTTELLQPLEGGGEHGPHALRVAPDGESLYVISGNHTELPPLAGSRVPEIWEEDQLLPRWPDPRGHAVGVMAPGGWLCRVDRNGREWELLACGMRNAYDFALDAEGECFTYDSDMEWDVGLPWYRPTRVLHLVSGADFGWRHGSGKWPASYPDSWPAVVDLGLGSPTGVEFAPESFGGEWAGRLLVADWTHGRLFGVELVPSGSSYRGEVHELASGKPLQITDLAPGVDGALYLTTGGRRTQSALYRLRWVGGPPAKAQGPVDYDAVALRHQRRMLESLHAPLEDPAGGRSRYLERLNRIWGVLLHPDPVLRRAARVALEHVPVEHWRHAALEASLAPRKLQALTALARCAPGPVREELLEPFLELDLQGLSPAEQIEALRVAGLIAMRQGPLSEEERQSLLMRVQPLWVASYDDDVRAAQREVFRLLVYLESPTLVRDLWFTLETSATQEERGFYLLYLSLVERGWTDGDRERYLRELGDAIETFAGGASLRQYLERARDDFLERLDPAERERLAPSPATEQAQALDAVPVPAAFVRAWSLADFEGRLDHDWKTRDLTRGKALYERVTCATCHRFDGAGGNTGPDLTAAGSRFSARDLLETILDPNLEVSDQYQDTEIITVDDELFVGRIEEETEERLVILSLPPEEERFELHPSEVRLRRPHPLSRMPAGLVDTLDRDELLDLLAYLIVGTDEGD